MSNASGKTILRGTNRAISYYLLLLISILVSFGRAGCADGVGAVGKLLEVSLACVALIKRERLRLGSNTMI